jgi:ATP-dependent Clp protease adaptor protein ClpS
MDPPPPARAPGGRGTMEGMTAPQIAPGATPEVEEQPDITELPEWDRPWVTVVWNDPVNLMSYVTWVFQTLFGYSRDKAERLMLDVHHKGKAIVTSGAREKMEHDASLLHTYGLWATVDKG